MTQLAGLGPCLTIVAGGGFSLDGGDEHLNFWSNVKRDLAKANKSISFLFVAYTLVPFGTYPTQFKEGVEALDYVLNDLGRSPSDVLLAGDSAGGNMCLALLLHLSHPSPDVPEVKIESKLKAVVLVAPWVSFKTEWPSMHRNRYKDLLATDAGTKWSRDYLGGRPTSTYAEALEAPASWWEGAKVEQLLCVAGSDELLLDPITKWVEKYKVRPKSQVAFHPRQSHVVLRTQLAPVRYPVKCELLLIAYLVCESRYNDLCCRKGRSAYCTYRRASIRRQL